MSPSQPWRRRSLAGALLSAALLCALCLAARARQQGAPAGPPLPGARFHHLHLNTVDARAAVDFYAGRFDCEKAEFPGSAGAVWAQKSWLLFSQVARPPAWELTSAVWHFGWGAEDMPATFARQQAMGTKFVTPLTDISDIGGNAGATGLFYYAYVQGPDRALIELNTANHHHFGHLHLFSADPIAAGEWYAKHLGARPRSNRPPSREPRFYRGVQIGPAASLMIDNVNIIIFPVEYAKKAYADQWAGKTEIEPTAGRVVDHVGFSFDNLAEAAARLRQDGVKVTDGGRPPAGGRIKSAFIEGPDKIRIELVEGHARKGEN